LVYRLGGGPSIKGKLADLGGGGARVVLERPLDRGEVVRLIFPRKADQAQQPGRLIIGHVVHSRAALEGYVVGVAFGWDAAVRVPAQPAVWRAEPASWFHRFTGRAKPQHPVALHLGKRPG
jgi:hypothetical protein